MIDDCTREALAIEIDTSLSSKRIIRTIDRVILERGKPQIIRTDNEIHIQFFQPGRPMQNEYIERFNRIYRESILDAYLFFELDQVRTLTEE